MVGRKCALVPCLWESIASLGRSGIIEFGTRRGEGKRRVAGAI